MSKHYATQCPECRSRFQVTLEQLNKAQGLVRCGVCMHVFAADQHLESAPQSHSLSEPGNTTVENADSKKSVTKTAARKKSQIPDVPLQLHATEPLESRWPRLLWSLLALTALITLVSQVLWFERDQLSQHPKLAALYTTVCSRLDCRLMPRQDLPRIHSEQLIIRDHPDYLDALAIDMLLINQAPFEQPFPALQLTFYAFNGDPKASRIFQPHEYLGGDFSALHMMPSNKQVRINLNILEPGQQAPSYRLKFIAARKN